MKSDLFSAVELAEIANRAITLDQELARTCENFQTSNFDADPVERAQIEKRIDAWRNAVAKGDDNKFRLRLEFDGLDEASARRAVRTPRRYADDNLPRWIETLRAAMNHFFRDNDLTTFLDSAHPVPFENILAAFVAVAHQRLQERAGANYQLLAPQAHHDLEFMLLRQLASYAAQSLQLEFSVLRARKQSAWSRLFALTEESDERSLYDEFVSHMRNGGLVKFFVEYAALARLLSTFTDLWVEANAEFLERLGQDFSALALHFEQNELGQVAHVRPSLSDPHNGRRTVIALEFTSGFKLIYKPKDLGTEAAYARLLEWLNARLDDAAQFSNLLYAFKPLRVLNCKTHGWVEFVEQLPCANRAAVERYYERAGALLCLLYILQATDCHQENIIACGEYPMLIDMETLMYPRPKAIDDGDAMTADFMVNEALTLSVLRTGLLPSWQLGPDNRTAYDISGLGGAGGQAMPIRRPQWSRVNTDAMALEFRSLTSQAESNAPTLDGIPQPVEEFIPQVARGFENAYRFLLERRQELLAPNSPLYELGQQRVRFIFRATRIYMLILKKLCEPEFMRAGIDRSIQFELLGRAYINFEGPAQLQNLKSPFWNLLAAERASLEIADVPFFTARPNDTAVEIAVNNEIENVLVEPSFELVLTQLRALDETDLARQRAFIQGALYAYRARERLQIADAQIGENVSENSTVLTDEEFIQRAREIGDEVAARAIRGADGSAAWIAPDFLVQAERFQLQQAGYDLYSGAPGIALFLAALGRVTNERAYTELARGAVKPLQRVLRDFPTQLHRLVGIGGGAGLGGIIYALTRLADFLDDETLRDDARRAAMLITTERVTKSPDELLVGTAGALLGLVALYDATADDEILTRALICGEQLVRTRQPSAAGLRAWATIDGKLMTGMSHGAAGIIYALARLYAVTERQEFLDAAREGIEYEDSLFSREVGNWRDLQHEQENYRASWCHGAPGIGLARLGALKVLDTPPVRDDINAAVAIAAAHSLHDRDHLCCGNMGRADILLTIGRKLERADLVTRARERASAVLAQQQTRGAFLLHPLLPSEVFAPAFFQGVSGIGYALLRMARPELPSVLLWE